MELTINVGKNVAEKIRLIAKLGGQNSEDLDAALSKAVDSHLSLHLIKLTKAMLNSVGVHEEDLTAGSNPTNITIPTEAESYQTTEELGGDLDTFDEINKTSEGSLTTAVAPPSDEEEEELEVEMYGEDNEVDILEDLTESPIVEETLEPASEKEEDEFKADSNSWQAGLMEEVDFDFGEDSMTSSPRSSTVAAASYNDTPLEDGSRNTTPDVLPIDLGIQNVSVESGSMKGSVDFMSALLNGESGDTTLRNHQAGI